MSIESEYEMDNSISDADRLWLLLAEYDRCESCSGHGEIYQRNYGWNAAEDLTFLGHCRRCDGTGEPSADVTISGWSEDLKPV